MKKLYTTLFLLLVAVVAQAQTYEFSISFIGFNAVSGNYQMALMATPSSTVVDGVANDMGAGFYVPAGLTLGNFVAGNSGLPASEWSSTSLSDTSDAYFISRVEQGTTSVLLNGDGPFELVLFDIIASPNPTSGSIMFVENGDAVFDELLYIQNYINIGVDDAYLAPNDTSANSDNFVTLSTLGRELQGLSIYPNPVKGNVIITLQDNANYSLLDINGRQVKEGELRVGDNVLNLSGISNGLYVLKLKTDDNVLIKKIIKD